MDRSKGFLKNLSTRNNTEDIAELRKLLTEAEEVFISTFHNNQAIKLLIDPENGAIVDCNKSACTFFEYTDDELRKLRIWDINTLDETETRKYMFETLHDIKTDFTFEHLTRTGEKKYVQVFSGRIYFRNKELLHSIIFDTTAMTYAERSLHESLNKLAALYNAADNVAFITTDLGGTNTIITSFSPGAEKIFGYSAEEVTGKKVAILHLAEEVKEFPKMQAALRAHLKGFSGESTLVRKSGEVFPVLFTVHPLIDDSGTLTGTLGVSVDITEQKKAEDELHRMYKELTNSKKLESIGRLAGGIAHDYNNSLSVIMGHAELALESCHEKDEFSESLHEILKASQRAANVTRQLLTFAKKQPVSPHPVNINESVQRIIPTIRRIIGENIVLTVNAANDLWMTVMDPSQISDILLNLCANARDAITDTGHLTISTSNVTIPPEQCRTKPQFSSGDSILLSVTDDGCGMEKEDIEVIFDPFFTTKNVDKGIGLGLSTVYGIVSQSGGFIDVTSNPHKGTIIDVYLPRGEVIETTTSSNNVSNLLFGNGETILVCEDDASILKLVRKNLESLNYTVLSADFPQTAMKLAKEHSSHIQILMTDVIMPEMNGRQLYDELKKEMPYLKVLYMSGYPANIIARHGIIDDEVKLIQKPFTRKTLSRTVHSVLNSE